MNRILIAIVGAGLMTGAGAGTATAATRTAPPTVVEQAQVPQPGGVDMIALMKQGRSVETVSCRDFAALDASFQPRAIRYAVVRGRNHKPELAETVKGVERLTPEILAACNASPGDHFAAVVHRAVLRNARGR